METGHRYSDAEAALSQVSQASQVVPIDQAVLTHTVEEESEDDDVILANVI